MYQEGAREELVYKDVLVTFARTLLTIKLMKITHLSERDWLAS